MTTTKKLEAVADINHKPCHSPVITLAELGTLADQLILLMRSDRVQIVTTYSGKHNLQAPSKAEIPTGVRPFYPTYAVEKLIFGKSKEYKICHWSDKTLRKIKTSF